MIPANILDLQKQSSSLYVYFSAVLLFLSNAALGGCFVYGGLTLFLHREEVSAQGDRFFIYLSEDQASNYMSIVPLLSLFGIILGYPAAEFFGRKPTLILANIIMVIGYIVMFFSNSFPFLILGRCVTCFALGFGASVPFIIISEITTIKQRAPLSAICTQSVAYGILSSFLFVYFFPTEYLIFFVSGESALFLLLSCFLPESPHFLIRNKKLQEAEEVYRKLRGKEYAGIAEEVNEIKELVKNQNSNSESPLSRWTRRSFLQPLFILMVLMFFIALNGVDCPLNMYGPSMFKEFGFTICPALISCLIPLGQLLGYIVAPFVMSLISKKRQYLMACIIMILATTSLALSYYAKYINYEPIAVQQVGLAFGSLGLTFGYGVGFGSVSYAMPGELLLPSDKSIGLSIAQCVRMIGTTVIIKVTTIYNYIIHNTCFTCRFILFLSRVLDTQSCLHAILLSYWQLPCLSLSFYLKQKTRACQKFKTFLQVKEKLQV